MENVILLLTDQNDQTDTVLSSALKPSFFLEKYFIGDDIDPDLLLSSRTLRPDCILVTYSVLHSCQSAILKSLSVINRSIPVITLLPFEEPELLRTLLDCRLFHYIIFPLSVNNLCLQIKEIISIHSQEIPLKDSFFSHPYFKEFRHELLNHLTIAAGYIDLLKSPSSDGNSTIFCEKISESIQKIQVVLSQKN